MLLTRLLSRQVLLYARFGLYCCQHRASHLRQSTVSLLAANTRNQGAWSQDFNRLPAQRPRTILTICMPPCVAAGALPALALPQEANASSVEPITYVQGSYTPSPVDLGWQIWAGFAAGIIPFAIGAYEFGKRIVSAVQENFQLQMPSFSITAVECFTLIILGGSADCTSANCIRALLHE